MSTHERTAVAPDEVFLRHNNAKRCDNLNGTLRKHG